jgi:predicted SAM-dependent methyltransferase
MECKVCGNASDNRIYKVKEMRLGLREEFKYYQCSACDCLQLENVPKNMNAYYPENYYSFSQPTYKGNKIKNFLMKKRDRNVLENSNNILFNLLNKLKPVDNLIQTLSNTNFQRDWKILDVGSGIGSKLWPLTNAGYNITGIDPYLSENTMYRNGLHIHKTDIFGANNKYNFIMLNHVFEHIQNPEEVLKKIHELLLPKGQCMIRVPVIPNYAWEKYQTNWVQIDAPRHFFIHSIKSMQLLTQYLGFEISKIIYDSTALQFIGSELYERDIPLSEGDFRMDRNNQYFSLEQLKQYQELASELNKQQNGDQAAFILNKK